MIKLKNLFLEKKFLLIIFFSLIFTEFYYFGKSSRILISNNYILLNATYLLIFSLIFFFILLSIINKFYSNISDKNFKLLISIIFAFIYFKIIQIPFFLANVIEFKGLILILLEKILIKKLVYLIPFLKIIIPYLIIFFTIYIIIENYQKILINFLISFSLIFFTFMVLDGIKRINHLNDISINKKVPQNDKKVLWFVLDEYDPSYVRNPKNPIKLHNISNLIDKSFNHLSSYSPSDYTLQSMPSILTKTFSKGHSFKDYQLYLHKDNNLKIKFEINETFLGKLTNEDFNYEIISEVLPYCSMLKIKTSCKDSHNKPFFYFDAIKQIYLPAGYFSKIFEYFKKREKFNYEIIDKLQIKDDDLFVSKKLSIKTNDLKNLINNDNNLIFLHLFIPHTKTEVTKHTTKAFNNMMPTNDTEEYFLNLKYTDFIIQKILEMINKNKKQDILLILSSDHWRRIDSPNKPKPSLLVVKIKKDNSKIELSEKNSNIFIGDIILEYLRGNINKHNDITSLFNNNEFDINDVYIWKKN